MKRRRDGIEDKKKRTGGSTHHGCPRGDITLNDNGVLDDEY